MLSGKQDSNLRPPASKTGKQPPLSFQLCRFTFILFRETAGADTSMNLCGLCENRTRSAQETVGQVTITSIDLFCGEQRNRTFTTVVELISSKPQQTNICLLSSCDSNRTRTCNPGFRKPMLYPVELWSHLPSQKDLNPQPSGHFRYSTFEL